MEKEMLKEKFNKNETIVELKKVVEDYKKVVYTNVDSIMEVAYQSGIEDSEKQQEDNNQNQINLINKIDTNVILEMMDSIVPLVEFLRNSDDVYIKGKLIQEISNLNNYIASIVRGRIIKMEDKESVMESFDKQSVFLLEMISDKRITSDIRNEYAEKYNKLKIKDYNIKNESEEK